MANQAGIKDALNRLGNVAGGYSASVVSALRDAANKTGTRFDALATTAAIESGMNPNAKAASSSATGLFQFVDQTWLAAVKRTGADHGLAAQAAAIVRQGDQYTVSDPHMRQEILDLRKDPKVAAAMAGEHLKDLSGRLSVNLGHAPDVTEIYMGHFLGAGGATQMLKALKAGPNQMASDVLPDAARANPSMFNGLTVSQFVAKVHGRVERAYSELNMPMPQGGLQLASNGSSGDGSNGKPEDAEWGKGSPTKLGTAPERLMLSSLTEVFTRIDRNNNSNSKNGHHGQMLRGAVQNLGDANPNIGV